MAPHREYKLRPHLDRRQRKAGASMNPIAVYAEQQRLSLTQLAAWLGIGRPYLSDVVNCRKANPKTLLANFARLTGIDPERLEADYQRCRAAMDEMEENRALQEVEESDATIPAVAPKNPLRQVMMANGFTLENLVHTSKGLSPSKLTAVLEVKASEKDAEELFALLSAQHSLAMIRAGIYTGGAMYLYRQCLEYKRLLTKVRERQARFNSWIDLSQPRALPEPNE